MKLSISVILVLLFCLSSALAKFDVEEFRQFRDMVNDEGGNEFDVMMKMLQGAAADIDGMWTDYTKNVHQVVEANLQQAIQK